ncbi:MAG: hypothetical protein ACREUV_06235 [Burkholderiales bacterium]
MKTLVCLLLALFSLNATAGSPAVYEKRVKVDLDGAYVSVSKALEDSNFFVVFEVDIGKNIAGFAKKWGEDYNRNKLEGIKSMVICSGWYVNQISNADPSMLALCPLHVTLTHKAGMTSILFIKPGVVARGSPAEKIAQEIENKMVKAIESAFSE